MVRSFIGSGLAVFALVLATTTPAAANHNILSNPGFVGTGGVVIGNVVGDIPDDWRAFAVGDNAAATIEVTALAPGDVHPSSPATNGVKWQVDTFDLDQGFDNNDARFAVKPATTYWSTFYAKSANSDGSDQTFRLGFPTFDAAGNYRGTFGEPGSAGGLVATSTWKKYYGQAWANDANATTAAASAHISWRVEDNGGDNSILIALPTAIEATTNIIQNPEFSGDGGVRVENVDGPIPDRWRAFAIGGGEATIDTVALAEDEVFPGSPAVDGVQWQVDAFAEPGVGDQGLDEDPAWAPIVPGEEYHAEFYVKSANADGSEQTFNFGFPIFDQDRGYLGREPGGMSDLTASSEWTKIVAPVFSDEEARFGHVSWRLQDDGGQNAILVAMPSIVPPSTLLLGDVNGDGNVDGLDVNPFVDVLLNGPYQPAADMNEDGEVNGLDVDPFVTAVVGGGVQTVPEPSTWLILVIGGLLLGCATRRQK